LRTGANVYDRAMDAQSRERIEAAEAAAFLGRSIGFSVPDDALLVVDGDVHEVVLRSTRGPRGSTVLAIRQYSAKAPARSTAQFAAGTPVLA
jgi:hypothetical protein